MVKFLKHILLFQLFFALLLLFYPASDVEVLAASKSKAETAYRQAHKSYDRLARSARLRTDRRSWIKVIKEFRKVYLSYPDDRVVAPKCLYMVGRCYRELYGYSRKKKDLDEAVERYLVLVERFPENRFADDALYAVGQIYSRTARVSMAKDVWVKLVKDYPSGDKAKKAKKKLKAMGVKDVNAYLSRRDASKDKRLETKILKKPSPVGVKRKAQVTDIRYWSDRDYTRVVVEASSPVRYKEGYLKEDRARKKPRRLYLDLSPAFKKTDLADKINIQDGLLKGVRIAQYNQNTVRVVFDLNMTEKTKIFYLEDPFRIVVDAFGDQYAKRLEPCPVPVRKESSGGAVEKGESISLARQLGLCVKRIVVDAGHGGKDPGAIGPTGLKEKYVVLKIAKKVARKLEKETDCTVILTRKSDKFLPLTQRTAIANAKKADLFLSIHANAAPSRKARGVETYFLNFALDKDAMRVAARENATSQKRVGELKGILNDIMKNTKVKESQEFAGIVQSELVGSLKKHYKDSRSLGVKQAPFFVLVGARMPSILVEVSFLSNRIEERRLKSDRYLESIATGIVNGVKRYVSEIDRLGMRGYASVGR